MLNRLMPREESFFKHFSGLANCCTRAAKELRVLAENPSQAVEIAKRIHDIEHEGDEITHQALEKLHQTFITPFDREHIQELVSKLDDVLDFIDACAQRVHLYDVRSFPKDFVQMADTIIRGTELLETGVEKVRTLKDSKGILEICVRIHEVENEADRVLRRGMGELFRSDIDVKELIKLKELYELMETVTDCCEDVANVLEGIVLEYA